MARKLESEAQVFESLVDNLSKKLPERKKQRNWSWMDTPEKAIEYYEEHHDGRTRSEVARAEKRFYSAVRRRGWRDEVFPPIKHYDWSDIDTEEKALQYYAEHLSGMSKTDVIKNARSFYNFLCRTGWLGDVFPEAVRRDWSGQDADTAKEYYEYHYQGMSRSRVAKEDSSFYNLVVSNGWQDEVFPKRKWRDWSWMDTSDKARAHYESNFAGKSRTEVGRLDSGFHRVVRANGWIDKVFPERKFRDWSGFDASKCEDFYEENFAGMSRSQVAKADEGFYAFVRTHGWLDRFFPPLKKGSKTMSQEEKSIVELLVEEGL